MRQSVLAIGLTSFSCLTLTLAHPLLPLSAAEMSQPGAMMGDPMAKPGAFVKGEHAIKGHAKVLTQQGKSYVEFDQAFKTEPGPDLYVVLYRQPSVPLKGLVETNYVSLGKLQKVAGTQRYAIPSTVKVANFASVAVWCRQFNATFGYASLK
jgi:hypothetical protein